jgi:drug/metabolite transporter (DMT)-like permease
VLSIALAVLAAVGNATASVLQRRADAEQPEGEAGGIRLLWRLAHRPDWLCGIAALVIGFLLQAAALTTGPVALVQPILVLELAFTLLLAQVVFRSRLHRREWGAVLGMSAGLAGLLYALRPEGGDPAGVTATGWAVGIGGVLAVSMVCALIGFRSSGDRRAALLGLATGIGFALTAVLVAGIGATYLGSGTAGVVTSPLFYLFIVFGPGFFYLLQKTFQAGSLVASQPALTLSDPVVGIAFGVVVFGERVRTGGWLVLAVVAAALVAACTVALARSPLLQGGGAPNSDVDPGESAGRTA